MANKEPEIAPTVSFRPASIDLKDKIIGDHKAGHLEQPIAAARGKLPDLQPPPPQGPAPTTSLASRLRARLDKGG